MDFNIIGSNLEVLSFRKGISVYNVPVGTLTVRAAASQSYTIEQGTIIADNINGMTFLTRPDTTYELPAYTDVEVTIYAEGSPIDSGSFSATISMVNGGNSNGYQVNFNVTDPPTGCERYIAIVVDESGSVSETEASQIRSGLTSFINSLSLSNTILSLIGMSNGDTNLRTDHVIQKRISDNQQELLDWVAAYGTRQIDIQSDYWASGLEVVNNLTVTPDIVYIITDGLQVNNTNVLQNLYSTLNQESHVFVYGVMGNYQEATGWTELVTPLSFYLERTPVLKENNISVLSSDYIGATDFSTLETELNNLTADLIGAQVGCISNVEILASNLAYPVLNAGSTIHQETGSLLLKNKSRIDLVLEEGTLIHSTEASLGGMVFTLRDTVTISAKSQVEVVILIDGTPIAAGNYSDLIALESVTNPNGFFIDFIVEEALPTVEISENSSVQSSGLALLAAGSKGNDSTKGIHLRWMLPGTLGENHLPKGDLFTGTPFGYNKPDDFVKVYRSPYVKKVTSLQIQSGPTLVDDANALWIYKDAQQRSFYVYFLNKSKYALIANVVNPINYPVQFIQAYGNELIEIENKSELFFAADLRFTSSNNQGTVKLESLSVAENTIKAAKTVSSRKTYNWVSPNSVRVVAENGRSIRFRANGCIINEIDFELYSDFIQQANENKTWTSKGKYGLSLDDLKVFTQLEPKFGSVHGKWLKYRDDEYVNTKNYKDKWNGNVDEGERNIKNVVEKYLELSNDASLNNPKAIEYVSLGDDTASDEEKTEISNLDLLSIASNDYHIARMLGLGTLDIDETVFSGDYIYIAEYSTLESSETNELVEKQHITMSIPVSIDQQRLPLPVELNNIVPGLNVDPDSEESAVKTTDENGYSYDGKKRYLTLFMKDVMELGYKVPFFDTPLEYDASSFTFPVYAGVKYKLDTETAWRKPDVAFDSDYYNVNKRLEISSNEPSPIIIPESQKPLLNLRQEETGVHRYWYQGYGVNLFSRAASGNTIYIDSEIRPKNTLIAPSSVNPLLIVEEEPLMFTSQNEQIRYALIPEGDKTYIRILFDYYSVQELQTYTIPDNVSLQEAEEDADSIFKDADEVYAEDIELFFRDSLPLVALGKITNVKNDDQNTISSVLTIEDYTLVSTGETVQLVVNEDNYERFEGGILTIADENYLIQKVEIVNSKVEVHVLKKEVTASILSDSNATETSEQLEEIKIPDNQLCSLVENMQTPTNWNASGAMEFKVAIPNVLRNIHREVVQNIDEEGTVNSTLEKTRGIWENAVIEKQLEDVYEKDVDGNYVLDLDENPILLSEQKHLGLYKITFPNYNLAKHPSDKGNAIENSVEWANGIVRLFTNSCFLEGNSLPIKSRKEFKVVRTENIGTSEDLILYIKDADFQLEGNGNTYEMDPDYDAIIQGNQKVNYYPGYRVYLFENQSYGITSETIQPREGESTHYSIIGTRSHVYLPEYNEHYYSKISVPAPMHAVAVVTPVKPNGLSNPSGSMYATRPDFYKRSTYTFVAEYEQKPHGVLHYRANDEALLSVLYEQATISAIREELNKRGGNSELSSASRWQNFLNFVELEETGVYGSFQDLDSTEESYCFPMPDNNDLIKTINDFIDWHNVTQNQAAPKLVENVPLESLNQVVISQEFGITQDLLAIHFIEQAIHAVFVPLTEVPVIYDLIDINRSPDYVPSTKKQTIKGKDGHILKATDPDFDMAPMMKIVPPTDNNVAATQFTDFNIDGTSNNLYFYGVREMDVKMNFGDFSPFFGPVKLVNSNPPQAPEIKRIMPVLKNPVLGINPAVQIELNAYHKQHNIKKITVYRALTLLDAQSTRTMSFVKEILVDEDVLAADFDNVWVVYDEFEDLENIPFGEGLFYRITVSREIEYEEYDFDTQEYTKIIDYTPSQPSKITATIIADNVSPESPVLQASGVLAGVDDSILQSVVLHWEKTVHNGKYHLYKMNTQGNWEKIHEIISNEVENQLALELTALGSDSLTIKSEDGDKIYHHFKLIAENNSGMYSREEKILSLYNDNLIEI